MTEAEGEHGLAETAARSGQEEQPKVFVLAMFENSSSFERKIMDAWIYQQLSVFSGEVTAVFIRYVISADDPNTKW